MAFLGAIGFGALGSPDPVVVGPLIPWATRESTLPGAPFVPIPAGQLDAVRSAVARLWKQFEQQPNWTDLMSILGQAWRDIDAQQGQVRVQQSVANAEGVQLDLIGELVDVRRNGLADPEYRTAIKVQVQTLIGSGTPEQVVAAVATIVGAGQAVTYTELYPATFLVEVEQMTPDQLVVLLSLLCDVPPAGVSALLGASDLGLSPGWGYTAGVPVFAGAWAYPTLGSTPGVVSPWGYAVGFGGGCN